MSYKKWLILTGALLLFFAVIVVGVNFYVDHHAVRLSLFSVDKEINQTVYPDGINQHMFNTEVILRHPEKFDSLLFGSSRTAQIDVAKISAGHYYNMSYSLGLPSQHLAILRTLLGRGVKLKAVVIGLDDISFSLPAVSKKKELIRIMHPEAGGPNRLEIFGVYFFRKPGLKELGRWKDRVLLGKRKGRVIISEQGVNLGWRDKDELVEKAGRPIFNYTVKKYEPIIYPPQNEEAAFAVIAELLALAREHHFSLTFFINPIYWQLYLNNADAMMRAKERLATLTDFYDFSGYNSVTTNAMNYYEESHYRYPVGDWIMARLFGDGPPPPADFGVRVTRQTIGRHLEAERRELADYVQAHGLK